MQSILLFLEQHQSFAYIILFFGSYFETLFFTSFFIYGEIFFVAGALLAAIGYLNIFFVSIALLLGGFLGDHSSYFLGRKFGKNCFFILRKNNYLAKRLTEKNFHKGELYFKKWGGASVFLGRLLGPASWITPFLAGIFRLPYFVFLVFDILGVFVGIGQFILIGYFLGAYYQEILLFGKNILWILLLFTALSVFVLFLYRKRSKGIRKN